MCVLLSGSKSPSQMSSAQSSQLKDEVQDFWNAEPCGSRYLEGAEDFEALDAHARSRYALEPHISQFAKFSLARGLRVLEIGVGMGADYLEWLRAAADETGMMLWLRYGGWRGKSMRRTVFDHLESPETKTYTKAEGRALMQGFESVDIQQGFESVDIQQGFESVDIQQVFSPGDLLLNAPS